MDIPNRIRTHVSMQTMEFYLTKSLNPMLAPKSLFKKSFIPIAWVWMSIKTTIKSSRRHAMSRLRGEVQNNFQFMPQHFYFMFGQHLDLVESFLCF